ncbi:glycosyltransferase [Oceanobacillus piezotolerans]|uniref:Glycosyltransferase n=1 Tax=Oceanobacillus piezotolerans TaxID=2448030 RepID=A0A498D8P3_9BACI|nr:glycosyltransferase [Oceanobacillus piezotolerans]RLL46916.1 glycosyltransferase [Oceanobacillus piezotolerans]
MVTVVTCTIRDHLIDNVFDNYENQRFVEKELIIILNNDKMDINKWRVRAKNSNNVSVFQLPEETTVGECQNFGTNLAKYNIIAKFDDDDYYSPYYLEEQLKALENTNAAIVGKRDCYYYLEGSNTLLSTKFNLENQFVDRVMDSSLMFRKDIISSIPFPKDNIYYDNRFQKLCRTNGLKIFSTRKENYVVVRRQDKKTHSWGIKDSILKDMCNNLGKMDNYKDYVTKPV